MSRFNLGWGGDTLQVQTGVDTREMARLQAIRQSIAVLSTHGFMTDAYRTRILQRLRQLIAEEVARAALAGAR